MTVVRSDSHDVLILGASGLLGRQLSLRAAQTSNPAASTVHCRSSKELDIRDRRAVLDAVRELRPGVVLNAAAYTDVDGCESDVARAFSVNAEGVENIASACRDRGAFLVQYSTDFVFDGNAKQPYRTTDAPAPISVYGASKLGGETAVRESGCDYLIIRTSWLFGAGGRNFVDTICSRAARGDALRVVADQVGRPTYNIDLADATWHLLNAGATGIVHFCNSGACSWHTLATAALRLTHAPRAIEAITSDQLHRPARRPSYSVLDTSEYERITKRVPRAWNSALAEYLKDDRGHADSGQARATACSTG